jgi:hypothetical protein
MFKLIVAFCSFANVPNIPSIITKGFFIINISGIFMGGLFINEISFVYN